MDGNFAKNLLLDNKSRKLVCDFIAKRNNLKKVIIDNFTESTTPGVYIVNYTYENVKQETFEHSTFELNEFSNEKDIVKLFFDVFGLSYKTWRLRKLNALFVDVDR